MRRVIQGIIFVFFLYVGFQLLRLTFNYVGSSLTLGQQSMLQLFILFWIAIGSLVITKLLSRYLKE